MLPASRVLELRERSGGAGAFNVWMSRH